MTNKKMKVAIVHDSYLYSGGAERVLNTLLDMYPQADVYIPLIEKSFRKNISKSHFLKTSLLNYLPFKKSISSLLKPFVLIFWHSLKLDDYDLVISSSHSFSAKAVNTGDKTTHISYIHTPPRYLYEEFNEMSWIKKQPFKTIIQPLISFLQRKDFKAAQRPNILIANSKTVQQRIKKYYQRESEVIYPPIKTKDKNDTTKKNKQEYYIFHSRLVRQKGAKFVIKAFNQSGEKLLIVGTGAEEKKLKKIANNNITFLGFITDNQISKIYQNSKALIYASIEEDFGLIPLEAMRFGIPIIGFESGGIKETVVDGKTGVLFKKYTVPSLLRAISKLNTIEIVPSDCRKQAAKFTEKQFKIRMKELISSQLSSGVK